MDPALAKYIKEKMRLPVVEGDDKRCSLKQAIERHVKEYMVLHLSHAGALVYQLIRSFWDRQPAFTVVSSSLSLHTLAMLKRRLARKFIVSFAGIGYPSPRPCPVVQNAYREGRVRIENWTMRTIPQRLLAGALGWDFMPTRSLIGSSMATENKDDFQVIDHPFAKGGRIGLLRALQPDITLVHGAVADPCGNTIIPYPLAGDAFGAWAATKGVIVSVDKIVSTAYIRKHAHMVRIPAYSVLAVCEAPFGAHPIGMTPFGLPDFDPYYSDYDFMTDLNAATMDEETFARWVQEWILDIPDHSAYLSRLGSRRLLYLKGKAAPDAWEPETMSECAGVDFDRPANALERLVLAAGRIIADRCAAEGHTAMLAGLGLPNLAAWMATYALRERGRVVDLIAEIGMHGYLPRTSDPTVFSLHNMHTCKMLSNIETALGCMVGGAQNRCLGVLGAGQMDPFGNANSTKVSDDFFLVGSGGANDIASTNRETIVVMNAGRHRLVKKVPYITYPGTRVHTLVTDVGVFEKGDDGQGFVLTAYLPAAADETEAGAMTRVKENVGWSLKVAPQLTRLDPPDASSMALLRLFDPRGHFIGSTV